MGAAGQAAAMRYARWSAAAIIVGVGAAAFRLSYSTLKDLAVLAHIPAQDAWLFPLIVDGTILLATFGVLVCPGRERRFFLAVLVIGSAVSVAGNSLHAVANGQPLPAWASAIVAAIAPVSLLADTHGLAVLFRVAHRPTVPEPKPETVAAVEPEPESEPMSVSVSVPEVPAELPEPEPVAPEPVAAPIPVAADPVPSPVRVAAPVKSVRSSRPVQQPMLPIAVPVGGH
ncbi:DUF2637 domain-containing protein [Nocardia farcinica]|uniref:DUF2637 domain-containing protein n=1 Tax=Nocardia farcinica TaxID=37329 RepID=UPI002455AD52|nr:DUF2637 domain-containing protein [Nocardia farcinica]